MSFLLPRKFLRYLLRFCNVLVLCSGGVLLGVGIWTFLNKTFAEELLRNSLYINTARILVSVGCVAILISIFGFYAAHKENKVMLLTYFALVTLSTLILTIGAVLAYVFKGQVDTTMKAEMIADIRNYDPDNPNSPVTWAWDATQRQLECCGMMMAQVSETYEVWRYSKLLNPREGVYNLPASCCRSADYLSSCGLTSTNVSNVFDKDCYVEAKNFVISHADVMGGVAVGIACVMLSGSVSSLLLFKSIV